MIRRHFLMFLAGMFLLMGCRSYSEINKACKNERIAFNPENPLLFNLLNNSILVNTTINDDEHTFIFDSRAPSVIFKTKLNEWTDTIKTLNLSGRVLSASGISDTIKFAVIRNSSNGLFSAENWLVVKMEWVNECAPFQGILGQHVFNDYKQILKIDFSNTTMEIIDENMIDKEWTEVKSKFRRGNFNLYLNIVGKEYSFGLDTGFSGGLLFSSTPNNNNNLKDIPYNKLVYGSVFQTASETVIDTVKVRNIKEIGISSSLTAEDAELIITDKIFENLVGIKFLKRFNLILDYRNKKVYVQPNNNYKKEPTNNIRSHFGAGIRIINDSLKIVSLTHQNMAEQAGFQINDIIFSVNAYKLNNVPCCSRLDYFYTNLNRYTPNSIGIIRNGRELDIILKF